MDQMDGETEIYDECVYFGYFTNATIASFASIIVSTLRQWQNARSLANVIGMEEGLQAFQEYLAKKNALGLIKGDKVKITGSGKIQEGIIEKINKTRAVVMVENVGWNVPFEMLRKI